MSIVPSSTHNHKAIAYHDTTTSRKNSGGVPVISKLYGRDEDVKKLLNALNTVMSGQCSSKCVFVNGASGVGKVCSC